MTKITPADVKDNLGNYSFENYLRTVHANQYCGLDDEMGEDCEDWISDLDSDMWILLGQGYGDFIKNN